MRRVYCPHQAHAKGDFFLKCIVKVIFVLTAAVSPRKDADGNILHVMHRAGLPAWQHHTVSFLKKSSTLRRTSTAVRRCMNTQRGRDLKHERRYITRTTVSGRVDSGHLIKSHPALSLTKPGYRSRRGYIHREGYSHAKMKRTA